MSRKLCVVVFLLIFASLLLTACGGSETPAAPAAAGGPAPFSQMAPDSKLDDVVKNMLEREKAGLVGFNIDMKGFSTTSTADDVNAYYREALKDWTSEKPEDAPAGITFMKWSKGNNAVFVLITFPMPDGSNGLAVVTEIATK